MFNPFSLILRKFLNKMTVRLAFFRPYRDENNNGINENRVAPRFDLNWNESRSKNT